MRSTHKASQSAQKSLAHLGHRYLPVGLRPASSAAWRADLGGADRVVGGKGVEQP